ncbi:hypothetical protein SAMN02799630_00742 [Paenibacillus sp. UNCCL117]|uniref:hypothetical protein n=1 Tax=unclassified Paenibacillus TaxID=185978 RepID=UPI000888365B|nr:MULTISPECIES: hypothetical protein [unclassified Paenibacillus]SDC18402.1 hypothetical protein SAMN04488602_101541 [Paenibacillus sp. cl123]SFW18197.1 hypothetical protein SAMN02799630_00742 [Paenibacillus sp. UNCCL117]
MQESRLIAEHPYYKAVRTISSTCQTTERELRVLRLFATRITTRFREFPLGHVYDMSYRRLGGEEGILYLHTRQGVYPFNVSADPGAFIAAFKRLRSERGSE